MVRLSHIAVSTLLLSGTACSTLNDSIRLGSSMGAVIGATAIHAGHSSIGNNPHSDDVSEGALVGLALGALTSYILHKEVKEERSAASKNNQNTHFGDLPPNPFKFSN